MRQIDIRDDDDDTTSGLKVSVPFLLCGLFLAVVWFFLPAEQWLLLFGMMVAYVVPPLGRETIIPVCILLGIPWWLAAFTLACMIIPQRAGMGIPAHKGCVWWGMRGPGAPSLHDEVPGHLLGMDVAAEEVGAGC